MPTSDSAGAFDRATRFYDRVASAWVRVAVRRRGRVLVGGFILTALLAPGAASLRIDTNLLRLLPRDYPVVEQMDVAIRKVGDLGYFSVVVEDNDAEHLIGFLEAYAARIRDSEYVRTVLFENPVDFLNRYRFLLLSVGELEEIHAHILAVRRQNSPFALRLDSSDGTEKEVDLEDAKKAYRDLGKMRRFHVSEDGTIAAMQIRPRRAVTDMSFVQEMYRYLQTEADALTSGTNLSARVSGSLKNKLDEYRLIRGDILRSVWISGTLILTVLLIFLRRLGWIAILILPLAAGLVWTFAFAHALIGYLDTISAMLFVVLFGLGIDHGIHLLSRYIQERATRAPDEALDVVLRQTGKPVWLSALTTAMGFFVMLLADFKGFANLGLIAGASMLCIVLAYFTFLPPLVSLAETMRLLPPATPRRPLQMLWVVPSRVPFPAAAILLAALVAGGATAASMLEFNYDFDTLRAIDTQSEEVKKKQSKVYVESLTPGAVLFAEDDATLDAMLAELHRRRASDTEHPTIGRIVSQRDFLPADQDARLASLRESARLITPAVLDSTDDPELAALLRDLKRSADLEPITIDSVPATILDLFTPQDGSRDHMIFVFPSIERKQGRMAIAFADDMRPIDVAGRVHVATGDTLVFAEILRLVVGQGLMILALAISVIVLWVAARFRRTGHALTPALSLFAGLGLLASVLRIFSVEINFYNMVIFAAIVGMGIDASIHLCARWLETDGEGHSADERLRVTLRSVAGPVTACTITTIAGYVGMVTSHHPGLRSIGTLAVTGLVCTWVVAAGLLPSFVRGRRESE